MQAIEVDFLVYVGYVAFIDLLCIVDIQYLFNLYFPDHHSYQT